MDNMIFSNFAVRCFNACLFFDEDGEAWYVHPEYLTIIHNKGIDISLVDVPNFTKNDLLDMLKLEAHRRNNLYDPVKSLARRLIDDFVTPVEETLDEHGNEIINQYITKVAPAIVKMEKEKEEKRISEEIEPRIKFSIK